MAQLVIRPLVKQTSTTEGTGNIVLSGTSSGFATFTAALANGDATTIQVRSGTTWENLRVTWQESTTTFVVNEVLLTSNFNTTKLDWSAGAKDVILIDHPDYLIRDDGTGSLRTTKHFELVDDDASPTNAFQIANDSGIFYIKKNGTNYFKIESGETKISLLVELNATTIDADVLKLGGTTLKAASTYDVAFDLADIGATDLLVGVDASTAFIARDLLPEFTPSTAIADGAAGVIPAPDAIQTEYVLTGGGFKPKPKIAEETLRTSWSAASTYTYAHGLGVRPDFCWLEMVCTTNDGGYLVGERVTMFSNAGSDANTGVGIRWDATNVKYTIGSAGINLINAGTGADFIASTADWSIHVVAHSWND